MSDKFANTKYHVARVGILQQLSVDQRETLLLVTLEELSYDEAAKVLGVPVGTIMSRLSRARTRLREITRPAARIGLWRVK